MPIPRCEHGVYSPHGDDQPSEYCSGCVVPTMPLASLLSPRIEAIYLTGGWVELLGEHTPVRGLTVSELGYSEVADEEEVQTVTCPACWSPMTVVDEYDLECATCGFNGL